MAIDRYRCRCRCRYIYTYVYIYICIYVYIYISIVKKTEEKKQDLQGANISVYIASGLTYGSRLQIEDRIWKTVGKISERDKLKAYGPDK